MSNTKIKAGQFSGIVGNGTDGYFLMTNGDGTMAWEEAGTPSPTVTSVTYPGDDTAADPAGSQSVTLTGTNFLTGATATIGGTTVPSVSFVSATELTITTPAKTAGDYDIVVTNTDGGTATFVDGISYNGIPAWTTASGSLGTFASDTTISTITLQASEPDAGTITFNITSGALPTGLSLTGADIDGTTSKETADTLYNFTVTAIDDENQSTPRAFSITIEKYVVPAPENFEIVTYTGNGGTQTITSKIGKAASFNGSSSYIDLGSSALKQLPMTISMWLNPITTANGAFYSNYSSSTEGFYCRVQSDGTFLVDAYNGASNRTLLNNTTGSIPDNTWSHVAITFDSSNVILYINGSETDRVSTNANGIAFTASEPTKLGVRGTSSDWFNGKIDQVRIFDKALDSSEVTTLYNEDYDSLTKSTTDIFNDNSGVALYELDEDANDTGVTIDSGQSGDFDSSDSRIENVYQIDYNNSISMWLNVDNTIPTGTYYGLWTQGDGTAAYAGIRYKRNSGDNYTIEAFIRLGNDYIYRRNTSSTWSPGWNHFVFLVNSTTGFDFYLNGNNGNFSNWFVAGTFTNVDFSNKTAIIGKYTTGTTTFKGQIDDVRFYSDLLTTTEIGYLAGNDTSSIENIGNFAAHYKLDGTATDEIGNNDGTWSGTETYSGPALLTAYNGTPTNIDFLGMAFTPDLIWIKSRGGSYSHLLFDSVRGIDQPNDYYLISNTTGAEVTTTDRFTLNSNSMTIPVGSNVINSTAGSPYVMWLWKAGGAAVTDTSGDLDADISANTEAGFSIIKPNVQTAINQTIPHGLDSAPELIIHKPISAVTNWAAYVPSIFLPSTRKYLHFNLTNAASDGGTSAISGSTGYVPTVDDTYITTPGVSGVSNYDYFFGKESIIYAFHSVDGYQKIGSYTGTGVAGNTITTGFQPRWVMLKRTNSAADQASQHWIIFDSERLSSGEPTMLRASSSDSEFTGNRIEFLSNGFRLDDTDNSRNGSGGEYIYLAIA